MKKNIPKLVKKHKTLIIISIIAVITIFLLFGAKIWLYINFLLGNDIVIKLTADEEYLTLTKEQQKDVSFKISVTTNPFCSAECKSLFEDLSQNFFIEEDSFSLRPGFAKNKDYTIKTQKPGEGIELYRFKVDCISKSTILCHTGQEPTSRSILLFVERKLTQEEFETKESLKKTLPEISDELTEDQELFFILNNSLTKLSESVDFKGLDLLNGLDQKLKASLQLTEDIQGLWQNQDFLSIQKNIIDLSNQTQQISNQLNQSEKVITGYSDNYNVLIENIQDSNSIIAELTNISYINQTKIKQIDDLITEFNLFVADFKKKSNLLEKERFVNQKSAEIEGSYLTIKKDSQKELLNYNIQTLLDYEVLCNISGICFNHSSINEIAQKKHFEAGSTCYLADEKKERFIIINKTLNLTNYSSEQGFWDNISLIIKKTKEDKKKELIENLDENLTQYSNIKDIFSPKTITAQEYPLMNLTAALTHSLIQQQITPCSIINKSFIKITPDNLLKIEKINITFPKKYFIFNDPVPQCCVYGKCKDCCISKECSTNISLYPIIIVHGHAFSKDTAADYSLDSFKKLQNKLEEDNYLNAGAISLYTPVEDTGAGWSILPVPISLKVSYYYDLFKEPENYITIQTKSENIDTYALRLKDLIDKVTSKTNKQKVIIIAHSMGGLVSRRYLQIFGNNSVEQLIMIGTPNNGISGNTLGYCSWIGEQLECRDMSSDSLFLNKLNRGQLIFVPTTNIIGSGCSMDLGDGDGTVLVEKAWLEGAQNYIINGTCTSIDQPLHMKMLDNHAYPEVYNVIKSVLMR